MSADIARNAETELEPIKRMETREKCDALQSPLRASSSALARHVVTRISSLITHST